MRILYLHEDPRLPGEGGGGGAETILHQHMAMLRARGHEVQWWRGTPNIATTVERFGPDLCEIITIHNFAGIEPALWLARRGVPTAWWLMDYWPFCGSRMLLAHYDRSCAAVRGQCDCACEAGASAPAVYRQAVNAATRVVSLNRHSADIYRRHGVRIDAVLPPAVDTVFFSPGKKKAPDRPARIVTSSAWPQYPTKGMHVLREALRQAGLRARLVTGASREQLRDELREADVFVFPSTYEETWGLCLSEAMSVGLACVASDVCGPREQIVPGVTGLLVPPRDAGALATALRRLVDDPALRRRMGRKARAWAVSRVGMEQAGDEYEAFCRDAIGG